LNSLDLGKCELGANGGESAKYIMAALLRLKHLEDLNLSGNYLDATHDLSILCEALSCMKSLSELMLQNNNLNADGALLIAKTLAFSKPSLHTLWLQTNGVSEEGKDKVKEALQSLNSLSRLELGTN
jgi:Ran GTPase-activating protein (RanGAP) involved in mRNA processing and transport